MILRRIKSTYCQANLKKTNAMRGKKKKKNGHKFFFIFLFFVLKWKESQMSNTYFLRYKLGITANRSVRYACELPKLSTQKNYPKKLFNYIKKKKKGRGGRKKWRLHLFKTHALLIAKQYLKINNHVTSNLINFKIMAHLKLRRKSLFFYFGQLIWRKQNVTEETKVMLINK